MGTFEKVNGDYQSQLNDWINQEKAAIDLINVVGKLWFEKSIELFYEDKMNVLWVIY